LDFAGFGLAEMEQQLIGGVVVEIAAIYAQAVEQLQDVAPLQFGQGAVVGDNFDIAAEEVVHIGWGLERGLAVSAVELALEMTSWPGLA
jgi:hypothetical protein